MKVVIWKYKWKCNGSEWQFQGPTYPPTEAIACPHAIYYINSFLSLSFDLTLRDIIWYLHTFAKWFTWIATWLVLVLQPYFVVAFNFDLWSLHNDNFMQSIYLLECIMVGSCVTTMIVFASNYLLSNFENPKIE